jgi:hypothetical protein
MNRATVKRPGKVKEEIVIKATELKERIRERMAEDGSEYLKYNQSSAIHQEVRLEGATKAALSFFSGKILQLEKHLAETHQFSDNADFDYGFTSAIDAVKEFIAKEFEIEELDGLID